LNLFKKVLSAGSGKFLNELNKIVDAINQKEQEYSKLSDLEVKKKFPRSKRKDKW